MRKLWLLGCYIFIASILQAQVKELPISVSYFGESVIHPGIKIGVEQTFYEKEISKKRWFKSRQNKLGSRVKKRELFYGGHLAFYNHRNNHTGLLLGGELGWRRTKMRRGAMFGATLGLGYLHRFNNIPTYELGTNEPDRVRAASRGMLVTSTSIILGQDLMPKYNIPYAWFLKPTLMLQTPYNHSFTFNGALELGLTYRLSIHSSAKN